MLVRCYNCEHLLIELYLAVLNVQLKQGNWQSECACGSK